MTLAAFYDDGSGNLQKASLRVNADGELLTAGAGGGGGGGGAGGATEATQLLALAELQSLDNKAPALGPAAPAASMPVVQSNDVSVLGPAGLSALNVDLLTGTVNGWYDAGAFQSGSVQVIASAGITAGAIIFEQTNETTLAPAGVALRAYEASSISLNPSISAQTIAASTARVWSVPVNSRFIRVRISTAFVGGTVQAAVTMSQRAATFPTVNVQQQTGTNLNVQTQATAGAAAFGATASGNPVLMGHLAQTAQAVARTAGQVVAALFSKVGHAITMLGQIRELNDTNPVVTLTGTTEVVLVPAVTATFNDIYSLTLVNTSATGVRADLRSVAAGPILDTFWLPPNSTTPINPAVPYKQATVNTAWTLQLSAAVTDVRASARTVRNI